MGEMSYNQIDHIKVIFRHDIQNWAIFSIEISIKNKKCLQNWGYGSIIPKIILWAHYTITHAV